MVFSNQAGVKSALEGKRAGTVKARIDALSRDVGVPLQAFCATQKDRTKDTRGYRKPKDGMWRYMAAHCNEGVAPDLSRCFYVGDAAGREGDHSDSDLGFARAVGVAFHTPEEFFLKPAVAAYKADDPADASTPAVKAEALVVIEDEDEDEEDELNGRNPDTP